MEKKAVRGKFMKKAFKITILIAIIALIMAGVICITRSKTYVLTNIAPEKVGRIEIFDGHIGKKTIIDDPEAVRYIIENFNSVKMKIDKVSLFGMGYSLRTTIYKTNGTVYKKFIVNSHDLIRKDPFLYIVAENPVIYHYLKTYSEYDDEKFASMIAELSQFDPGNISHEVVVVVHNELTNVGKLNEFLERAKNKRAVEMRVVQYTTEGDPIITKLLYDGIKYYMVEDDSRDQFGGDGKAYHEFCFSYLKAYEENDRISYYLLNDDSISLDDIQQSMLSSNSNDYIPHAFVMSYVKP